MDCKTLFFWTGEQLDTEHADLINGYLVDMKKKGWVELFQLTIYNEEKSNYMKKPTFSNTICLVNYGDKNYDS
jgi:hypothetical protein